MKKLKFLLLCLFPLIGYGQTYTGTTSTWSQNRGKIGSDLGVVFTPGDTSDHSVPIGTTRLNSADFKFYSFNGSIWILSSGSGGDTYSFTYPLIDSDGVVKVDLSDYATTDSLTSGLARKQDLLGYTSESTANKTTSANGSSNSLYPTQGAVKSYVDGQIGLSTKYTDTALMLSPYAKKQSLIDTAAALRNSINSISITDTTSLSNRINARVKYTDTAAMLAPYASKANLSDTSATLRGLISSSVVDTTSLSTRINQRVKYTDTAAMLSPYTKSANAMKYTDTATMLVPYLRKVDTASLSNRIELRVKYTDTAAMLTPYLKANTAVKYTDTATMLSNYMNAASNGLTKTGKEVKLGGALTAATSITATGTNTLAIAGLQSGSSSDSLVVSDPSTGVLKRISPSSIGGGGGSGWSLTGNSGLSGSTNFIGNTDDVNFNIRVGNVLAGQISQSAYGRTMFGLSAGASATGTFYNTGIGAGSMYNTSGQGNTGVGYNSLGNAGAVNYSIGVGASAGSNFNSGSNCGMYGYSAQLPDGSSNAINFHNALWILGANGVFTSSTTPAGRLGIGTTTPHASAILDLTSSTQGLGLPSLTTTEILAISPLRTGLVVFNKTLNTICFYDGTAWQKVTSSTM